MRITSFVCFGVSAVLSSCASQRDLPNINQLLKQATGQNGRACIQKADIQGYGVLENNLVSIDGRHRYFLATVLPGCTDLHTSIGAAFTGKFHEICGGAFSEVITRDGHCTINQIYEFTNRDEAFSAYNTIVEQRRARQAADD